MLTALFQYQKRGYPHIHLLIKVRDPPEHLHEVCNYVSGRLPHPKRQPELYKRVKKYMLHSRCEEDPTAWCRQSSRNGQCRFHFPQPYTAAGFISQEDGRMKYPRKSSPRGTVDPNSDCWVASYSPELLMKWDGHIHVDYCTSIVAARYMYKVRLR
jgi:hypothetical protein